jgi:hypothetical protein
MSQGRRLEMPRSRAHRIAAARELAHDTDTRLDRICDRVIEYMDNKPVADWEGAQWGLFAKLWGERKNRRGALQRMTTHLMSTEELQLMMTSSGLTNSDDP